MNQPDLSLIFVNYRSADVLSASLSSLRGDIDAETVEAIVVNNDPSERETLERLAERFPMRIIHSEKNIGFGAASNRGVREARADLVGFLNPDTRLVHGSLGDIAEYFRTHTESAVAGAALLDRDGNPERWSAGPATTLMRVLGNNLRLFRGLPPTGDEEEAVGFVSGAALFARKQTFERLGGFDERFFLYFEDMDLCLRVRESGTGVVCLPSPVFMHEGGTSRESASGQKRHYYGSQDRYFRKHRPKWEGYVIRRLRRWFVR